MKNGQRSSLTKYLIPTVVIVLLFVSVLFFYKTQEKSATSPNLISETSEVTQNESTGGSNATNSTYEDGIYTVTGNYVSPGGPREINVSITLASGVIVDSTFEGLASDPTSQRFQGEFGNTYKDMVIGKNIDEVNLNKVSGSSLTPKGFSDALNKIKEEASL